MWRPLRKRILIMPPPAAAVEEAVEDDEASVEVEVDAAGDDEAAAAAGSTVAPRLRPMGVVVPDATGRHCTEWPLLMPSAESDSVGQESLTPVNMRVCGFAATSAGSFARTASARSPTVALAGTSTDRQLCCKPPAGQRICSSSGGSFFGGGGATARGSAAAGAGAGAG